MSIIDKIRTSLSSKPSILSHIQANLDPQTERLNQSYVLPDQELFDKDQLRFVSGAVDGIFSFHMGESENVDTSLYKLIATRATFTKIHNFLVNNFSVQLLDQTIEQIIKKKEIDPQYLYQIGYELVTKSTHRNPVKVGIALLGIIPLGYEKTRLMLLTLAKHEEFTLYTVVAVTRNEGKKTELVLWKIAQDVQGWGRIHAISRLKDVKNIHLKNWLIEEGYKNSVMDEYLAYIAAKEGDLLLYLDEVDLDTETILNLSKLIIALIQGGPAENINAFKQDIPELITKFLDLLLTYKDLYKHSQLFVTLDLLNTYIQSDAASKYIPEDLAKNFQSQIKKSLKQELWNDSIIAAYKKPTEELNLYYTRHAAQKLNIDTWKLEKQLLEQNNSELYWLLSRDDLLSEDKVRWIVEYVKTHIDLKQIATGAANELGLGEDFKPHREIDPVLQALENFPQLAKEIVEAALQSPVTRNRNHAINVILKMKQDDINKQLIKRAYEQEPNSETKKRLELIVSGLE